MTSVPGVIGGESISAPAATAVNMQHRADEDDFDYDYQYNDDEEEEEEEEVVMDEEEMLQMLDQVQFSAGIDVINSRVI